MYVIEAGYGPAIHIYAELWNVGDRSSATLIGLFNLLYLSIYIFYLYLCFIILWPVPRNFFHYSNAWVNDEYSEVVIDISFQINCVVMRGFNEEEVCDFVALTEKKVVI